MFCPHCGLNANNQWKYCAQCGNSLHEAKETLHSGQDQTRNQGVNNPASKMDFSTMMLQNLFRSKAMSANQMKDLLNSRGSQTLLKLQDQEINENQLQILRANPNVTNLMNQMKSKDFQQKLIQGLMQMQKSLGGDNASVMQGQTQQIQGLFNLLNNQSLINQSPRP